MNLWSVVENMSLNHRQRPPACWLTASSSAPISVYLSFGDIACAGESSSEALLPAWQRQFSQWPKISPNVGRERVKSPRSGHLPWSRSGGDSADSCRTQLPQSLRHTHRPSEVAGARKGRVYEVDVAGLAIGLGMRSVHSTDWLRCVV